jgi:hypothetical protein
MTMRIRTALLCAAFLLGGCAGPSGPEQSEVPGFKVSSEAISVVEFSQDGAWVHYNSPHDTFGLVVAQQIADYLRQKGHSAQAVPAGAAPVGPIVVTGRITMIDAGSRAARYFAGFGAGAAKFGVAGSVQNAQGEEIASFSDERWSGWGIFGGSSTSLVQKCMRSVGRDVGQMIHTGEYKTVETGN